MTLTPDHRFAEAKLISTSDSGAHGERKWIESPATLDQQGGQWVARAKIPGGSTAWFMNFQSGDLLASSDLFEVDHPGETDKPAVSDKQSKLIARMDKDADGKVSQSEYIGHYESTFARFDTDESGKLDAREFTNSAAVRFGDSDKDGKLTLAEYLSVFEKQFSNLDKDSDGYVESEEW
jgi:hypothetical protein